MSPGFVDDLFAFTVSMTLLCALLLAIAWIAKGVELYLRMRAYRQSAPRTSPQRAENEDVW